MKKLKLICLIALLCSTLGACVPPHHMHHPPHPPRPPHPHHGY